MSGSNCRVVSVGKRRDGGTRYWCLEHKADATAKYGRQARRCRYADIPPIPHECILSLDVSSYPGGVALWGAVPPVYDTTRLPLDRGIHVHARRAADGSKEIDRTYRAVKLFDSRGSAPNECVDVSDVDAIYYMTSSVFGFSMKNIECIYCGWSHLDKDWFSVHPHRSHLCAGCGKHFRDVDISIGNPICRLRSVSGVRATPPRFLKRVCRIRQAEYPGGIRIWGSNSALLWTSDRQEEEGVHVHAFAAGDERPTIDDTFSHVEVDGVRLDSLMVRFLMAQCALPHIEGRVVGIVCGVCGAPHFDTGEWAFTPHIDHSCDKCGAINRSNGRLRKTVGNPLVGTLESLASTAPRPPQRHALGLLPETL